MEGIKESLLTYDQSKNKFNELYPKVSSIKFEDDPSDLNNSYVYINKDKYIYCVLGRFDNSTNFWEWGWSYEITKNKVYATRVFLNYGIDNFDEDFSLTRKIIVNSKIKIEEKFNLDIILAISLRFLHKFGFGVIYNIKESPNIDKYIILKEFE
jgi:hypothetical protein